MSTSEIAPALPQAKWMTWTGRVLSAGVALMLTFSAWMKLQQSAEVLEFFVGKFGYPASSLMAIGVIELLCVVVYLIPRTQILGAILLTGYLGGAIATHVRIEDAWLGPFILGIVAWVGLTLRHPRLRQLLLQQG